jgi:hypothetical protein
MPPFGAHKATARKALRVRVDNTGGAKRRRDSMPAAATTSPFGAGSCDCGGDKEPAPAPPTLDPNSLDLAPYEAAAVSLVIRDKAFWRLRWAVGQMAGHHRSQGIDPQLQLTQQLGGYCQAVPAAQLVDLLREGWGGVLMTASQARQLQDVLAFDGASEPRPVDADVHYALCCRVVDWWNLPLSYTVQRLTPDSGATAAVEAYTVGRRLPPSPEAKSLVAEMAEQSACVERQLAKGARPAPWSWSTAPHATLLRQLGLSEASAALESAAQAAAVSRVATASSSNSGDAEDQPMVMSQGSDMEM